MPTTRYTRAIISPRPHTNRLPLPTTCANTQIQARNAALAPAAPRRSARLAVSARATATKAKSGNGLAVLAKVQELGLLSKVQELGLLSKLEASGLTLSKIEESGLLTQLEKSGVLTLIADK